MAASGKSQSVLFICLGNICRSPMAEAIFTHMVKERGLESKWRTDSAATSTWEIGNSPDRKGQKVIKQRLGINMKHTARQITTRDFTSFDYILGMDEDNISDLKSMAPKNATAKIELLGSYDPQKELIIEDPYYGEDADFEKVYEQCTRCCGAFLDK